MKHKRQFTIPSEWAVICEAMLNRLTADPESEDVPYTITVMFGGGIEADIKLCNGDSPYVDAVLFEGGEEVQTLEVTDTIEGEYVFEHNGDQYVVVVEYDDGITNPRSINWA